VVKPACL